MPLTRVRALEPHYDAEAFAREFARTHKRRVKRYGTLAVDGRIADHFAVSARQPGGVTLRITCDPRNVSGDIDCVLPSGMSCSIGAALTHFTQESPLRAGRAGEFAVYVTDRSSERVPELLDSPALIAALDSVGLGTGECIQTASAVGFVLVHPTQARVTVAFDALIALAVATPREPRLLVPPRFPAPLRPIAVVILEWGILDARARANRVADAHPDALRRLIGAARYHAARIKHYLAHTRYPDGEAAQVVRAFADAAALATVRMHGVTSLWSHRPAASPE